MGTRSHHELSVLLAGFAQFCQEGRTYHPCPTWTVITHPNTCEIPPHLAEKWRNGTQGWCGVCSPWPHICELISYSFIRLLLVQQCWLLHFPIVTHLSNSNNLLQLHSKPMEDNWSPSASLCPPEQILLSWHRQIPRWFPGARITCSLVWILFKQKDMTNCLVTLINGCPWGIVRHEMKLNNSSVHYSPLPHHLKCLIVPKKWIPF